MELHNEWLNDLYSPLMKSRKMGWAEHVAHIRKTRGVHRCIQGFGVET